MKGDQRFQRSHITFSRTKIEKTTKVRKNTQSQDQAIRPVSLSTTGTRVRTSSNPIRIVIQSKARDRVTEKRSAIIGNRYSIQQNKDREDKQSWKKHPKPRPSN